MTNTAEVGSKNYPCFDQDFTDASCCTKGVSKTGNGTCWGTFEDIVYNEDTCCEQYHHDNPEISPAVPLPAVLPPSVPLPAVPPPSVPTAAAPDASVLCTGVARFESPWPINNDDGCGPYGPGGGNADYCYDLNMQDVTKTASQSCTGCGKCSGPVKTSVKTSGPIKCEDDKYEYEEPWNCQACKLAEDMYPDTYCGAGSFRENCPNNTCTTSPPNIIPAIIPNTISPQDKLAEKKLEKIKDNWNKIKNCVHWGLNGYREQNPDDSFVQKCQPVFDTMDAHNAQPLCGSFADLEKIEWVGENEMGGLCHHYLTDPEFEVVNGDVKITKSIPDKLIDTKLECPISACVYEKLGLFQEAGLYDQIMATKMDNLVAPKVDYCTYNKKTDSWQNNGKSWHQKTLDGEIISVTHPCTFNSYTDDYIF